MTGRFLPGLCSVTFRNLPVADVIALASEAGLAGIEWGGDIHVPPGEEALARSVGEATRARGLAVTSYGSYLRPPTVTPGEVDAVLDTAAALGAPMVRIWPGARGRPSASYSADERAEAARSIAMIAERAAGREISIGLEFHPDTLTDETRSAEGLMSALAAAPGVFLYWQPRPGLDEAAGLVEIVRLHEHIAHLHVFHWDDARNRYPLADQRAPWRAWMEAAAAPRWDGPRYAMLEFVAGDNPNRFREDAAALHAILADG